MRTVKPQQAWRLAVVAALGGLLIGCGGSGSSSKGGGDVDEPERLELRTLSTRADLVSGGDVLVEVALPEGLSRDEVRVQLNGADVTERFAPHDGAAGSLRGLVEGLKLGENTLTVKSTSGKPAEGALTVINHPITGPILSGPHLTPYECRTEQSGLGAPLDMNCSAEQRIDYFYRADDDSFKPFDPTEAYPEDLVHTTTNAGKTVPYIVRVDSGTVNRTIYRIAVLDDPTAEGGADEWKPGEGWNRRLVVSFGGSAGTEYHQGVNQATDALSHLHLSRGFAYMISTELVNGRRGDGVLQGETLMMLKEYFIERYGVPQWTVGSGGSGGAIQQLVITQMYPGLLDGLQPSLAFPDSRLHIYDCILFQNFYGAADDPAAWTAEKKLAVEGMTQGGALGSTCGMWAYAYGPLLDPTQGCGLSDESLVYHPVNNPTGARCTTADLRVNVLGRDPVTGFARNNWSNRGLQYGLSALNSGAISVDEFLELNESIGGLDVDGNITPERTVADPVAVRRSYEAGYMASYGPQLGSVPILHYRPYTDSAGDIHDFHRDFTIRARLERANGRSDNQVIWVGPYGYDLSAMALDTMTQWLDKITSDPAPLSINKVVKHKPAAATDACWDYEGNKIAEKLAIDSTGKCTELFPIHSEPRLVAGAPLTNDIHECQLKPVDFGDYEVSFDSEQKARLQAIFPEGVCDWSKPGVEQTAIAGTYQSYMTPRD